MFRNHLKAHDKVNVHPITSEGMKPPPIPPNHFTNFNYNGVTSNEDNG